MKKLLFIFIIGILAAGCGIEDERKADDLQKVDVEKEEKIVEKEKKEEKEEKIEKEAIEGKDILEVKNYVISTSSVLVDETNVGFNYEGEMVGDKDFSTAWCSGEGGTGDVLTMEFSEPVKASKLGIVPGFARDEKIYFQNNRIKKLKMVFDGEEEVFNLPDEYRMHFLNFCEECTFQKVDFIVEEVYEGSKYDDTCIAEIDFWSDYVVNENEEAAMNYYKNYKEADALRPYDIVSSIMISDRSPDSCMEPRKTEKYSEFEGVQVLNMGEIFVTAFVNQYGREGDEVNVKWYHVEPAYPDSPDYEEENEWVFLKSEKSKVVESCDGNLYIHTNIYPAGEVDVFPLGIYKVNFYHNGKFVGSGKFRISQ
ncbi:hypothetical protein GF366_03280 [Candidatus Peregrinibacteria bacterium]|nr:hypothetical protein [Candidatus Peregrinibacteria bacterium]